MCSEVLEHVKCRRRVGQGILIIDVSLHCQTIALSLGLSASYSPPSGNDRAIACSTLFSPSDTSNAAAEDHHVPIKVRFRRSLVARGKPIKPPLAQYV